MKDHEKRELVNRITAIARKYSGTQQLRERIAGEVLPALDLASQVPDIHVSHPTAENASLSVADARIVGGVLCIRTALRDQPGLAERAFAAMQAKDAKAHAQRGKKEIEKLRTALTELRDRIRGHPAYAEMTQDEEIEVGGDTAELSYLARVADEALAATAMPVESHPHSAAT